MVNCRIRIAAFLLGMGLCLVPLAAVAESGGAEEQAVPRSEPLDDALRGAAEQIMNALRLMVLAIPQYEAPEILENGDIIIRRRPPDSLPDGDELQDSDMGDAYQQDL